MRDISEFIYGEEYLEKNKAFEAAMAAIEEKHLDFFQSRPPRNRAARPPA